MEQWWPEMRFQEESWPILMDAIGGADVTHVRAERLVNAMPIGMVGGPTAQTLSLGEASVDKSQVIFDVVALPSGTPLIRYAELRDKRIITGAEVFAIQATEQFVL